MAVYIIIRVALELIDAQDERVMQRKFVGLL